MSEIYLKFTDEATAKTVMAQFVDDEGNWITASHEHALDPIGALYAPTGNMLTDSECFEYQEMAPIPGWHMNFVGELPKGAEQYVIEPTNPQRRFA